MADDRATFAVTVVDEASGAAKAAASALDDLQRSIQEDTAALSRMRKSLRQMSQGGLEGSDAFKELKDRVAATIASIGASNAAFLEMGGTFDKVVPKKKDTADKASVLAQVMGPLKGKLVGITAVGTALGNALTALPGQFIALTQAILGTAAALVKFGVSAASSRRSEALQIEGLNTLRESYGLATASVEEYQAAIDQASRSSNVGRGELQNYARQLSRTGLRGQELTDAVEAMGIAATVQGERGAARFRALAASARLTGQSVSELAKEYRDRLGPIARRMLLDLDVQTQRLKDSFDAIFFGLDLDPFLSGLDEVFGLFSQSTASGRALKAVVEEIMQPLINAVGEAGPFVKKFFEGIVIGGLVVAILFKRIGLAIQDALKETFGEDFAADLDLAKIATTAGVAVFGFFTGVVLGLAAAFVALVAPVVIFIDSIRRIVNAFGMIKDAAMSVFEIDFAALGTSLIDGLVDGITSGASRVIDAMSNLGSSAIDAFKSTLGIASPSSVFAGFGMNVAQGAAMGIDEGAGQVADATERLVSIPTVALEDQQGATADEPLGAAIGSGAQTSIVFGDIVLQGVGEETSPRDVALMFRDELASLLEGVNVEIGAPA